MKTHLIEMTRRDDWCVSELTATVVGDFDTAIAEALVWASYSWIDSVKLNGITLK
jgi:hypothetical protein